MAHLRQLLGGTTLVPDGLCSALWETLGFVVWALAVPGLHPLAGGAHVGHGGWRAGAPGHGRPFAIHLFGLVWVRLRPSRLLPLLCRARLRSPALWPDK